MRASAPLVSLAIQWTGSTVGRLDLPRLRYRAWQVGQSDFKM